MEDQPTKRGGPLYWLKRRSRRFWVIAVVLLPVFYVGSFGPACWLCEQDYLNFQLMAQAYRPLILAADKSEHLRKCLIAYASFCGSDALMFWLSAWVKWDI